MSKTAALRLLIKSQLDTVQGETYHRRAEPNAKFPYKEYELSRADFGDSARDDIVLEVNVWDRAPDSKTVEEIADEIEALFNVANLPQETILPTFFRTGRQHVDDPDKDIQRIMLTFLIQLYTKENGGED